MAINKTKRTKTWRDEAAKDRNRKNTFKLFKRIFAVFIAAILVGGIVYALFFCPLIRVREIKISGVKAEIESQISDKAKEFLSRKTLLIFPNDSIVLFNSNALKTEIEKIGGVKNASVSWNMPNSLEIKTEERRGVLNWCQADRCSVVDEEGTEISGFLDSSFAIVNSDCRDGNPQAEKIHFIQEALDYLSKINLNPKSFYLESCFTQKLSAKVAEFEIYFDLSRSVKDQIEVLQNVLEDKNRVISEYVDLQVEGRVYYK